MVYLMECRKAFRDSDFFQYTVRTIMYLMIFFNL